MSEFRGAEEMQESSTSKQMTLEGMMGKRKRSKFKCPSCQEEIEVRYESVFPRKKEESGQSVNTFPSIVGKVFQTFVLVAQRFFFSFRDEEIR